MSKTDQSRRVKQKIVQGFSTTNKEVPKLDGHLGDTIMQLRRKFISIV